MTRKSAAIALTLISIALASGSARAQTLGRGTADDAFLFRVGGFFPAGGGPLWDSNEQAFTLDINDFDDATVGFGYLMGLGNRIELAFNVDFYDQTVRSEDADYVDTDGYPILHDTTLSMVPITVDFRLVPGGRYRLRPGGQRVLKPVFYVGAGAGTNLWSYEEEGDFVDVGDPALPIFYGRFEESGAALETHLLTGVEFPVSPRFNVTLEARYSWSDDKLNEDLAAFDRIELGGGSFLVGGAFRF